MRVSTYDFTPEELEQMFYALRYQRLWLPLTEEEREVCKQAETKIKAYLEE